MVWQVGNCTDTALDIDELIIAMINEKNQRTATPTVQVHLHSLVHFGSCFPVRFR